MEKYSCVERLSMTAPQVIIRWPCGLEGPPQIFPLADSLEESEKIRRLLEERLASQD